MNPIRCLIVDDERLARQGLRDLLAAHPDFQIVAEAADITEAAQSVRLHRPDVLFLDIAMPGGDGFQLLDALAPDLPFVVFVTAYDRYALRAFEVNALDYLLKPVEAQRLAVVIQRLRARMGPVAVPVTMPVELPNLRSEDRVFMKVGNSGCFVQVQDILYVTAQGNHSAVQVHSGQRLIIRETLASWLARLPADRFAQLDRSCIVQWSRIQHTNVTSLGGTVQFDAPGAELRLGRNAAQRLRRLLAEKPR